MNRRNFILAVLAALGLRKLPQTGYVRKSLPFGAFSIPDEPFATQWNSNTATAELARLMNDNRRFSRFPGYHLNFMDGGRA